MDGSSENPQEKYPPGKIRKNRMNIHPIFKTYRKNIHPIGKKIGKFILALINKLTLNGKEINIMVLNKWCAPP